jgi:1,4-alpha-glucan branching enzyme
MKTTQSNAKAPTTGRGHANRSEKATQSTTRATVARKPVSKKTGATSFAIVKSPVAAKPAKKTKAVTFKVQSKPGSKVYIAGDFNEWNTLVHELIHDGDGVFQVTIELEPGIYEYKFHIDGNWHADPENPNFRPNYFGTLNSVIIID